MGFLLFLGIIAVVFFAVAGIAFILRDRTGKGGYEEPPSCPSCRKK